MANANVLKSYLVGLGLQDNMSPQLKRTLRQSQGAVRQFAKGVGVAGLAITGMLVAANAGIVRFLGNLKRTDDRIQDMAAELGKTNEQALATYHALNAMGRTMEEVEASPELMRQFQQLQRDAANIQIPDMSDGLAQVRGIHNEFGRLRNIASHAVQWIGHHLMKYLYQPMQRLREVFSNLNDRLIGGMQVWTRRIASVMAAIVRMTTNIIRFGRNIFDVIRRIFDMIPTEVAIIAGVIAGFFLFLRAGPMGKFMMIFSLLMLMVDDFFTYMDGGEAALGPLWRMLMKIWDAMQPAITWLLEVALPRVMDFLSRIIGVVADAVIWFFELEHAGAILMAIAGAIGAVVVATRIWNAVSKLNPKVLIIAAIMAAIAGLIAIVRVIIRNWERIATFFRNLWNRVTAPFRAVAGFFRDMFRAAADAVMAVFRPIADFFVGIWNTIRGIFSAVGSFFGNMFQGARDAVERVFSPIVNFFTSIWDAITGIFQRARDMIMRVVEPILNAARAVGNFFGRIFGRNRDDGEDDETDDFNDLPQHAMGGIFRRPHIAQVSEDGPEAIIPLNKPNRAREVLGGVLGFLGRGRQGIQQLDAGLGTAAQSTYNYTTANTYNNYQIDMPSHYNIKDVSGRPEAVAKSIDRTKQNQLRNLQGVLNS